MARIQVKTDVRKIVGSSPDGSSSTKNNFLSTEDQSSAGFITDYCATGDWEIPGASGPTFDEDILSVLDGGANKGNATFIHVQCKKKIVNPGDIDDPVRFSVYLDGVLFCKVSQIQLADIKDLTSNAISIRAIDISGSEIAVLSVIMGFNK